VRQATAEKRVSITKRESRTRENDKYQTKNKK